MKNTATTAPARSIRFITYWRIKPGDEVMLGVDREGVPLYSVYVREVTHHPDGSLDTVKLSNGRWFRITSVNGVDYATLI